MRLRLLPLFLLAALVPWAPGASAHDCNGYDCGACRAGEYHNHNDMRGQCASGPGYFAKNGWDGQSARSEHSWSSEPHARFSPGGGTIAAALGLAGAALLLGRRAA